MKTSLTPKKIVTCVLFTIFLYAIYIKLNHQADNISPSTIQQQLGIFDDYSVPADIPSIEIQPGDNNINLTVKPSGRHHRITFYYQCEPGCPELWLTLPGKKVSEPIEILVEHPIFKNLPMPYLTNNTFSLYQPEVVYTSISSFLHHLPQSPILTEPQLIGSIMPLQPNIKSLKNYLPESKNYVFTTYIKPRLFGDWFEFTRIYDISPKALTQPINATISAFFPPNQELKVLIKPL